MELNLKKIRKQKGLTQDDLADATGKSKGEVSKYENGKRRANTEWLQAAASYLGVPIGDLFTRPEINISGQIGAGGTVEAVEAPIGTIPLPIGIPADSIALQIKGSSMQPEFWEGDIIFYAENNTDLTNVLNGRPVIVKFADDKIGLKRVARGETEHSYTLLSSNAPPIENVTIQWVAKIEWVQRK